MKLRTLITIGMVLSLLWPAWADQEGTVSLSLQRFLELTRQQQGDSQAPPLAAALGGSTIDVSVEGEWARVHACVNLQTYAPGWNELAILPGQVLVARAELDGKPLSLYLKDDQYHCMLKGAGRHRIKLTYHLPVGTSGPSQQVTLITPASSASRLTLRMGGKKVHLTSNPEIPLKESGKTRVGVLPQGHATTLTWTPLSAHPELRGQTTAEKPKVYARLTSLVQVTEKAVRNQIQVEYSILRNQMTSLELALPKECEVLSVNCSDLEGWTVESTPEENRLKVSLSRPWSGHQSLELTLEKPLESIDSTWDLPLVRVLGAERVKGSVGLGASSGIELEPVESEEVRPIDVTQLPTQLTQRTHQPLLLAYEYHHQPFQVTLKTHKGKELTVLTATIDRADATTVLTPEGKLASVFVYHVRNNRKQSLSVTLPSGTRLLNAFVNGLAVRPVREGEAQLRLPLVLSSSAESSFEVRLTLLQEGGKLLPVANHRLVSPILDIPISELNWQVCLPERRHVWATGGSVRAGSASFHLAQGQLPVALSLPLVGQRIGFRQLMVTGEAATVELMHASRLLEDGLWWSVLAFVLFAGSGLARRPGGGKKLALSGLGLILASQILPWPSLAKYAGAALLGLCLLGLVWTITQRELWLSRIPRSLPERKVVPSPRAEEIEPEAEAEPGNP